MKQRSTNTSNTKSNSSTKGKSKTFLGKWGEGWELGGALESVSRAMHSSASRALDISIVVIDDSGLLTGSSGVYSSSLAIPSGVRYRSLVRTLLCCVLNPRAQ